MITYLYAPALDGTESWTTTDSASNTTLSITNGLLTNGCGYLTAGWSNTVDWELSFDFKNGKANYDAAILTIPNTTTRNNTILQLWSSSSINYIGASGSTIKSYTGNDTLGDGNWHNVKITKTSTTCTIKVDNTTYLTISSSDGGWLFTESTICYGHDKGNYTSYLYTKNIKVIEV